MKNKPLLQLFILCALLAGQSGPSLNAAAAPQSEIIIREVIYLDGEASVGSVSSDRFERWPFVLGETASFIIIAIPTYGDLIPSVLLLDANGNEITHAPNSISDTQPAGNYFIQVQPVSGAGSFTLVFFRNLQTGNPNVVTSVDPNSIFLFGSYSQGQISLNDIPDGGYTSAEFSCIYNPAIVTIANFATTAIFGSDPVMVVNQPVDSGGFTLAIAGSNGKKALLGGPVFTFDIKARNVGQLTIDCQARASRGDGMLINLPATPAQLMVASTSSTLTGQVYASKQVTITLYNSDATMAATLNANAGGVFNFPAAPDGFYIVEATAPGFLSAQGTVTLANANTITMPTIKLRAGDIDGNNIIDQFDAMTIGINYNNTVSTVVDLNDDGIINVLDMEILAGSYRAIGPTLWQ